MEKFMSRLETAQSAANRCSGENAPDLRNIVYDNVLQMRRDFLLNVAYNGKESHRDIITVLKFMTFYCYED